MWNTIKHLLILLAVIAVLAAAVVMTVNNSNTTGFGPQTGSAAGFQPPSDEDQPQFTPGQQTGDLPVFQGGSHERDGGSSFGVIKLLKNLGIIAAITAVIVLLENIVAWIKRSGKTRESVS